MKLIKNIKIFSVFTFLGVYLLTTGISFAVFDYLKKPSSLIEVGGSPVEKEGGKDVLVDISGPKTEICPLNGEKFTKKEKEVWQTRRPLAVMIENHTDARPQSGLSRADVIYEAVAEGGITRFMAVFYCGAVAYDTIVGPVRSARTYFLDWASEYGETPLYAHVGGAHCDKITGYGCQGGAKADALGQIASYGWEGENDLNQFSIGYPTFWRDYERLGRTVATEHTMYSTTERLWAVGKKRGWTNLDPTGKEWSSSFISWQFKDGEKVKNSPFVSPIEFSFWQGYSGYEVKWEYDESTNKYKRFNGGVPHLDLNTNQQLETTNVVIQFMKESPANDGYPGNVRLLYGTIGEGKVLVFQNGQVIEGKWVKRNRLDRTRFYNTKGKEIDFVRGKIWIEILPINTKVSY